MKTVLRAAAVAAILVATAAVPVAAAEEIRVSVSGSDVAAVHARIVRGAREACAAQFIRGAHSRQDMVTCIRDTTDDAVARSGRADLAAFHASLSGNARYAVGSAALAMAD